MTLNGIENADKELLADRYEASPDDTGEDQSRWGQIQELDRSHRHYNRLRRADYACVRSVCRLREIAHCGENQGWAETCSGGRSHRRWTVQDDSRPGGTCA